jgi:benzoyl-CoA 2,3-epoxidase subunit B
MQRVVEPDRMAGWIEPPDGGINANPAEYEYAKL